MMRSFVVCPKVLCILWFAMVKKKIGSDVFSLFRRDLILCAFSQMTVCCTNRVTDGTIKVVNSRGNERGAKTYLCNVPVLESQTKPLFYQLRGRKLTLTAFIFLQYRW
jgi:hypothetical protein